MNHVPVVKEIFFSFNLEKIFILLILRVKYVFVLKIEISFFQILIQFNFSTLCLGI